MSLKIRLTRGGTKKRPFYKVVVADVRAPRDGRFIEKLGTYNPLLPKDHGQRIQLNEERVRYWLSHGAQPTDRVARFLDAADILTRKPRNNPQKGKPHARTLERAATKAEAIATAKEAPPEEVPQEEASQENAPQEDASAKEEAPQENAPQEDASAEE